MRRTALAALCALPIAATSATASAAPVSLTLEQAISRAASRNDTVQAAQSSLAAAASQRKATRGKLGPSLDVNASVNIWNQALDVSFAPPGATAQQKQQAGTARVRNQLTSQVAVTLSQPIAVQLFKGYKASKLGQRAAHQQLDQTRSSIVFSVAKAYIQLKQAHAGAEIAATSVKQVKEQLRQGRSFYRAGVIGKNDLLKLELALAEAEAAQIRADAGVRLAGSALAVLIGEPTATPLRASQEFADPPPEVTLSLKSCLSRAIDRRPDLRVAQTRVEQARTAHDIALWNFAPQLSAVATYQNIQGQTFFPKNSFFFGGVLKWNVWNWGQTYYAADKAGQQVSAAEHRVAAQRSRVELEVRRTYLDLKVAEKTLHVTRKGIDQAEENYRIEKAKFSKQASTAKDLLDAQLALTRAQLTRVTALYSWYVARAALAHAIGDPLPVREMIAGGDR